MTETPHTPSSSPSTGPSAGSTQATLPIPPNPYAAPQLPQPPQSPPPSGDSPTPASSGGRNRRSSIAVVAATGLLAGALGAGLGAGAVVALDNGNSSSPFSSAPDVSGVSSQTLPNGSVAKVAASVLPSVVSIQFQSQAGAGSGSGVIIDESGLILTNNHVVEAVANGGTLTVTFQDGTSTHADVVGTDPESDLAVVKVSGVNNLKPITFGNSDALQVGETVIAIGSPLGLNGTVTTGIVSAKNRPVLPGGATGGDQSVLNAIQTDAAINPGNSGGALVNLKGQLVGINSAIASLGGAPGTQSGSIGLGFAIPVDQARWIANELIQNGTVQHSHLGVSVENATGDIRGARITQVESGSTADSAGLQTGDVVTGFGDQAIDSSDSLVAAVRSAEPGTTVTLRYVRGGNTNDVQITLQAG